MAMRFAPAMYPVTQRFYANATAFNLGAGHGAIDIGVPPGTPLLAPEDGTVVFDGWAWDLPGGPDDWHLRWYLIKPARGDTKTGGGIITIFRNSIGSHWGLSHASRSYFHVGDRVRKGQVLQLSGNTGSSTGPHTHGNLWPPRPNWSNGYFGAIDPEPYLTEPYAPLTAVSWQGSATTGAGSATAKTVQPAAYRLVRSHTSKNYTPANQVPAVYGMARKITGVTVHWWGDPATAGTHASVAAYLSRAGGDTSAHAVVSKGLVEEIVPLQHAAWHAGHARGNAQTIGIECDPRDVEGTLPTLVAYLRDLEKTYGPLNVYGHRDWSATACPGDYYQHITRIVAGVNAPAATVATITASSDDPIERIFGVKRGSKEYQQALDDIAWAVWSYKNTKVNGTTDAYALLTRVPQRVLEHRVKNIGTLPDGTQVTGTTTLAELVGWHLWRGYRSRRIEAALTAIAEAVRPSTLAAVLRGTTKTEES